MAKGETEVLCARCKVPLEGPANPKGSDRFACPKCGTSDTLNNVERELGQQIEEQATDALVRSTRGSKHVTFEAKRGPKRRYRFVLR